MKKESATGLYHSSSKLHDTIEKILVISRFAGLNIDSKPSDSPMPDDFEKTGAISDLLLEVREQAQVYFEGKWQHVFFIGLLLRTCEVTVISVVEFLATF